MRARLHLVGDTSRAKVRHVSFRQRKGESRFLPTAGKGSSEQDINARLRQ